VVAVTLVRPNRGLYDDDRVAVMADTSHAPTYAPNARMFCNWSHL